MDKGLQTQESILQAAFKLFIAKGYHGTSMRDIARAAGLAPGSLYNHFEGKEAIFYQVLQQHHPIHQVLPILESAQGEDAEALIRNVANRVYDVIHSRKDLLNLLFIELVEFEGRHFGNIFNLGGSQVFGFINKMKQSRGDLRPISTGNIFLSIVGLVLSQWMMESAFLKTMPLPDTEDHFEAAVDIYLHGVLATKSES